MEPDLEVFPPPDRTKEAAPEEDGDGSHKSVGVASPDRVTDASRRVPLIEWQRALREADDLTATEHHVALAVAAHMAFKDPETKEPIDEAHCFPHPETLAKETHLGRSTVYEALAGLEDKGWIFRERRPRLIWGTVPDGGEVIPLTKSPGAGPNSPGAGQISPGAGHASSKQVGNEVARAAPSFTDDPEVRRLMLRLAEVSGANRPESWARKVYSDDIAPIIEEEGRDAGLAEIDRRIASKKPRPSTHYPPDQEGHGDSVATATNW